MNRTVLENFIQSTLRGPSDFSKVFADQFEPFTLDQSEFLIKEGKISKAAFFLERGIVRSFTLNLEGEEVTTELFSAPGFPNHFLSLFGQKPYPENFQAITSCEIWKLSFEQVQKNFHSPRPEFREFGRLLSETNYSNPAHSHDWHD